MSSILTLQQRKKALITLGEYLLSNDPQLSQLIDTAHLHNSWFTPKETGKALHATGKLLQQSKIEEWIDHEGIPDFNPSPKEVGLVLAGNIPLVGFHDILSVLVTGHIAKIKLSSSDRHLIPHLLSKLIEIEPEFSKQIQFVERLDAFDAVIATGSNNTSRYFEYYFAKVPHIIRKNRNSISVLSGKESTAELTQLGHDIFDYFGLGCRSVSKLFVPEHYTFDTFFETLEPFKFVIDHHKYHNNYDYNKSVFLVNRDRHLDNGFLLLKEDPALASPLAVLHYEQYNSLDFLEKQIADNSDYIQCVVTGLALKSSVPLVRFGQSQQPALGDYADRVNTVAFLLKL